MQPDDIDREIAETSEAIAEINDNLKITEFTYTDLGNGERFAAQHGENVRHVTEADMWYVWNGQKWKQDKGDGLRRLVKETVESIQLEYAEGKDGPKYRNKHFETSQSNGSMEAMLKCARNELPIPVEFSTFDNDRYLLNCGNGTVEVTTGAFHEHRRDDYQTKQTLVDYNESATCPMFEAFLETAQRGNRENIAYIQRAVGYAATAVMHEKCLFFLQGPTDTGKTLFLETIKNVFGDYAGATPTDTLAAKQNRSGKIPNDLARLRGLRLVVATESDQGDYLHEALVKQLTGGDTLVARFLNKEFFEFEPVCKFFFATNHLPRFHGGDSALQRRIRLIPFNVQIPEADQNHNLKQVFRDEAEGILQWIIRGAIDWAERGLATPAEILNVTAKMIRDNDALGQFFDEKCIITSGAEISRPELFREYRAWSEAGKRTPMSNQNFQAALESRGFYTDKVRKRFLDLGEASHYWRGIRLRTAGDLENPETDVL